MSHRFTALIRGVGAVACVLAFAPSIWAQDGPGPSAKRASDAVPAGQVKETAVDVTGTWNFQVEIGGTTGTPTMTFKQEGEKLSGRYSGQLGEAPLTGSVKGNAIEFSFDASIEGNAIHVVYSGTVEKDSMKGTAKFGDFGDGTFTAKRKQ